MNAHLEGTKTADIFGEDEQKYKQDWLYGYLNWAALKYIENVAGWVKTWNLFELSSLHAVLFLI